MFKDGHPPGLEAKLSHVGETALNVLEVIAEAGYVLAVSKPTPEMMAAGARAAGISPAEAQLAYEAMLAAI